MIIWQSLLRFIALWLAGQTDIKKGGIVMIWQNNSKKTVSEKRLAEVQKENEQLKAQMESVMAAVEKLSETKKG